MRADPPRDNLPPQMHVRCMDDSGAIVPPSVMPSIPPDRLEPAFTEGARMTRAADKRWDMAGELADAKASAKEWKDLYLCELYRGDREHEEHYSVTELDRVRAISDGWQKRKDKHGITVEYQS